ncbi:YdcF family protein [Vibrio sp.]|uniref:YdcF family protein n=1 Tax=Vibrio sp. TaxID=678 RepID=UPI003D0CF088
MSIKTIILVLGKRLYADSLTPEGESRVLALIDFLSSRENNKSALLFCGGVTAGQRVSEAQAMYDRFCHATQTDHLIAKERILLEQKSTNTVENIRHGAEALIQSGLVPRGERVKVVLVSNDYHLRRLLTIQQTMDEQGLLRLLKHNVEKAGLTLNIPLDIKQHVAAPYPYHSADGELFLRLDQLTVYRVYLEGVVAGVFTRPLEPIRQVPYHLANHAINEAMEICAGNPQLAGFSPILNSLQILIEQTGVKVVRSVVKTYLDQFHRQLTDLNRNVDPESIR